MVSTLARCRAGAGRPRRGWRAELGEATTNYPHGVLDRMLPDGTRLLPDWALQVPDDYLEVLRTAVPEAVRRAGVAKRTSSA